MFKKTLIFLLFILLTWAKPPLFASQNTIQPSLEQKTSSSPKWRIIYIEQGAYIDFPLILKASISALHALGLIDRKYSAPILHASDTAKIWQWLSKNAGGEYIEFVSDGFYSANWDQNKREENKKNILERIETQNDIDLILSFGTGASLDMATNEHAIPTITMSVTDPVGAGILHSIQDSGLEHVSGQIELGRCIRQLTLFHDIFNFKKLGVPIPDTQEGKAAIAYEDILLTAQNKNFEIIPCDVKMTKDNIRMYENLQQCIEELSQKSDAIYLTINAGMKWRNMPELLEPIIKAGIPSFSQNGITETKLGVLMSIAQNSFKSEGAHAANTIRQIIEGAVPRSLNQVFEVPLTLALNLKMAMLIGWNPPFHVLTAIDTVYEDIYVIDDLHENL